MFCEIEKNLITPLLDFHPFPSIKDRNFWCSLDEEWKSAAIVLGEKYLNFNYPYISATDFMHFFRTGNRVWFENKSFCKRQALDALVLAECVENKGRFLDDIINGIFSICEESAWQLPPHNDSLLLPDVTEPILDLFACEQGAILACAYYLLGDILDEISPLIGKRIRHELRQRIYLPYLNRHFWWMGNGIDKMCNWTIWCTQNVLLSVFLMENDKGFQRQVLKKACQSIDYFIAEYGEDGCCDEGAQYYRHAGLCLFLTMEILNTVTDSAFADLYQKEKIKNMAAYIFNVHVDGIYFVNFADCSPVAGRAGVREFLFAKRTDNQEMMRFAAIDFMEDKSNALLLPSENNLYYRALTAANVSEIKQFYATHCMGQTALHHPDFYYSSVGLFIARDEHLYLAVKAGDNADSHNHNDTGSFTIYKDGKPFFIDVGVESYTQKTFSLQRYEIWTMQSSYHNLPTIGEVMQRDGKNYAAKNVSYHFDEKQCEMEMDIAGAYPEESGLNTYIRKVSLQKGKKIIIRDVISWKNQRKNVLLNLMTYDKPALASETNTVLNFTVGDIGSLDVLGAKLLNIEEIPITDARLQTAWKHEIYRIQLALLQDSIILEIL